MFRLAVEAKDDRRPERTRFSRSSPLVGGQEVVSEQRSRLPDDHKSREFGVVNDVRSGELGFQSSFA